MYIFAYAMQLLRNQLTSDCMKQLLALLITLLLPALPSAGAAASDNDNVVIADELRVYTIVEKKGEIASVKSETDVWYQATVRDDRADAIAFYNDDIITIDKASAPGAKPYYRSWESSDAFYDGSKVCYMSVPLKKGKKTKATFVQTFKAPEHFCNVILPSYAYPKRHSTTIVKVPPRLAQTIKVETYRADGGNITLTSQTNPDGSVEYRAEATDLPAWRHEAQAPRASVAAPQLIITGQFADARALYRHMKSFCREEDEADEEIAKVAATLRAGAADDAALADSTAQWVRQNIRYLAVEHGEYAFSPARASDVMRSRAGDCKGSANLIKRLLRENGLDGRLVWIGTKGDIPFDWDKVPALCSGNHVIAACMLGDSVIYLDGTTSWSSPGYVPPSIRGRRTMIEDGDDCILGNVPDTGRDADRERIRGSYAVEGNALTGSLTLTMAGVGRMGLLSALADSEPSDRDKIIKRVLTYPRKNTVADDLRVSGNLSEEELEISARVSETNAAQKIGDKIYVDLKPLRDSFFDVVATAGRTHSHLLPFGYTGCYEFELAIPAGYRVEHLPEASTLDNEWYEARLEYEEAEGAIRCRAEVKTRDLATPLGRLEERNEGVRAFRRAADAKIVLTQISLEGEI